MKEQGFVFRDARVIDYYAVLGVKPTATFDQIHNNYMELAKKCHPDVGGDANEMAAVNEAWLVLRDAGRRKAFDKRLNLLTKLKAHKCVDCKGTGRVTVGKGLRSMAKRCAACGGSGMQ